MKLATLRMELSMVSMCQGHSVCNMCVCFYSDINAKSHAVSFFIEVYRSDAYRSTGSFYSVHLVGWWTINILPNCLNVTVLNVVWVLLMSFFRIFVFSLVSLYSNIAALNLELTLLLMSVGWYAKVVIFIIHSVNGLLFCFSIYLNIDNIDISYSLSNIHCLKVPHGNHYLPRYCTCPNNLDLLWLVCHLYLISWGLLTLFFCAFKWMQRFIKCIRGLILNGYSVKVH